MTGSMGNLLQRFSFLRWWVLACALAFGVWGAVWSLTRAHDVGYLSSGIVLGLAQWLVLRRRFRRMRWWVPASIMGGMVGAFVVLSLMLTLNMRGTMIEQAVGEAVLFAVIGCGQWPVLRRSLRRAGWWPVFSGDGGAVFGVVSYLTAGALYRPLDSLVGPVGADVGVAMVGGLAFGVATGIALVWLERETPSETEAPRAA
ncbi:MAG: hypothetical protein HY690_18210 [Chloroflexi bacterium]|nr:hypothetical protein [Chloroflexota bacterium]